MKGIIFTEFLEMVEIEFGFRILNQVIDNACLDSKGVYSGVGTYDFKELEKLIEQLSILTNESINDLLKKYGNHIFHVFLKNYPNFFLNIDHPFQLLEQVDSHIHMDVQKLYPDAELPSFTPKQKSQSKMEMLYKSKRRMEYFALGLMEASMKHYNTFCFIEMKEINRESVLFVLTEKQ